jgi:hypothetical protein
MYYVEIQPTFRKNMSLPSSGSKNKSNKKVVFATCFMLNSFNGLHGVIFRKTEHFASNFRDCLSLFTSSTKLFAKTMNSEKAHAQWTHVETVHSCME